MKTFFAFLFIIPQLTFGQDNSLWQEVDDSQARLADRWSGVQVNHKVLNTSVLNDMLANVKRNGKGTLPIPGPDGNEMYFDIIPSNVLAPELQAKYPAIRTYKGQNKKGETIRLSYGTNGLRATIFNKEGAIEVKPESPNSNRYVSYKWSEYNQLNPSSPELGCDNHDEDNVDTNGESSRTEMEDFTPRRIGDFHSKYRLAIIPDLDYVDYFGGTVEGALNGIATSLNTVNEIYERDLGITIELIADNDQIIYTQRSEYASDEDYELVNDRTDRTLLTELLSRLVGVENYDVGELFQVDYPGGIAGYRSVCDEDRKGRAISGVSGGDPEGYVFDVTVFAHELGHQFGSLHTFSTDCAFNDSALDAFEVGSGVTIMGYYFNCGGSFNSAVEPTLDYFNIRSIDRIIANTVEGESCGVSVATGNTPPVVNVPVSGFTIPINTPFILEAEGSDSDGDDITYCWEQYDLAVKEEDVRYAPIGEDDEVFETVEEYMAYSEQFIADLIQFYIDEGYSEEEYQFVIDLVTRQHEGKIARFWEGDGPLFRSFYPTTENIRYFPELSKVVDGTASQLSFEVMPHKTRDLNFVVTVRDNSILGSGIATDIVSFSSTADAGPFVVTSAFTEDSYNGLTNIEVKWDVANTDTAPVNCMSVDILYSTDGGENFDIVLLSSTSNDGSEVVKLPNIATSEARFMIRASENIFFNVNDRNFSVSPSEVDVPISPSTLVGTRNDDGTIELSWSDNSEVEDGFIVERQIDNGDFEEVERVALNVTDYSDEDAENAFSYTYRIASFNATGNSEYSNTVFLEMEEEEGEEGEVLGIDELTASIYPNPTKDRLYVELHEVSTISITDLSGKELIPIRIGTFFEIDLSTYNSGMYLLVVKTKGEISTQRVFKVDK